MHVERREWEPGMRRIVEGLPSTADPPSNVHVLETFEPFEPGGESPPTPSGVRWTVVDVRGNPRGQVATRSEAVRLMSTLAGRMPGALPLRVMDREGHETGDRLA
jgi:hypothetical protein